MPSANDFVEAFHTLVGLFMSRSMRDMEYYARQRGLAMVQLRLLMHLHYHQQFTISDIGDQFGITPAAASQMVQKLFEQALIDRVEDAQDRRIKRISLTGAGKALVAEMITLRHQWMESIANELSQESRDQVVAALGCLNETVKKLDTP
jgi:DNA-binding MarR family transcriptional regulator